MIKSMVQRCDIDEIRFKVSNVSPFSDYLIVYELVDSEIVIFADISKVERVFEGKVA